MNTVQKPDDATKMEPTIIDEERMRIPFGE